MYYVLIDKIDILSFMPLMDSFWQCVLFDCIDNILLHVINNLRLMRVGRNNGGLDDDFVTFYHFIQVIFIFIKFALWEYLTILFFIILMRFDLFYFSCEFHWRILLLPYHQLCMKLMILSYERLQHNPH